MRRIVLVGLLVSALAGCAEKKKHCPVDSSTPLEQYPLSRKLSVETTDGRSYTFDIKCFPNGVMIENTAQNIFNPLRFAEASPVNNYQNVLQGDFFVLSNPATKITRILRYEAIDSVNKRLVFSEQGQSNREVSYNPSTGEASIVVPGTAHAVLVDVSNSRTFGNLSVDQNGDNKLNGAYSEIFHQDGTRTLEKYLTR